MRASLIALVVLLEPDFLSCIAGPKASDASEKETVRLARAAQHIPGAANQVVRTPRCNSVLVPGGEIGQVNDAVDEFGNPCPCQS